MSLYKGVFWITEAQSERIDLVRFVSDGSNHYKYLNDKGENL